MKITSFPEFIDNLWVSIQTLDSIPYSSAEKQIEEFLRALSIADEPDWSDDEFNAFEIAFYFCTRSVHNRLVHYPKFKSYKAKDFLVEMGKLIKSGAKIRTRKKQTDIVVEDLEVIRKYKFSGRCLAELKGERCVEISREQFESLAELKTDFPDLNYSVLVS